MRPTDVDKLGWDFDRGLSWYAVPSDNAAEVANFLLVDSQPIGVADGVARVNGQTDPAPDWVYVLPSFDGWVVVVVPNPLRALTEFHPPLQFLSEHFGQACYFVGDKGSDRYCWGRGERGVVERVVLSRDTLFEDEFGAYTDTENELYQECLEEDEEHGLGYCREYAEVIDIDFVAFLAGKWSVNPVTLLLQENAHDGQGYWGTTDVDMLFPLSPPERPSGGGPQVTHQIVTPRAVDQPVPRSWRSRVADWLTRRG